MKLAIMQPYFFPYIGYWQLIKAVDNFVIYDDVNYIKGGWINRNRIMIQGESKYINLQIDHASPNKLIKELHVLKDNKYNEKLLKTIEMSYKNAPICNDVFPLIESIIMQEEKNLAQYLAALIRYVCKYLDIKTEILISSRITKNDDLKGEERVVDICKIIGADEYINSIGGKKLYSIESFALKDLQLKFLEPCKINYQQFNGEFIPNLSIIDVMMFNEPIRIAEMLNNYTMS